MDSIKLTREQLYKLVWETPTKHLCKQFGLSDVGLAKTCKRHDVPKPPAGYWAKKAHGWGVRRTPLPQCRDPRLEKIEFRGEQSAKEEASKFFDPEIEALYEQELKAEPITVRSSLRGPHPLVTRFQNGGDDEWRLAIQVSQPLARRALLIMDALLKGLEKRGYSVKKPESRWSRETTVVGHGHEFGLRLREPTKRSVRDLTPSEIEYRKKYPSAYHRTDYQFTKTGELQLEIRGCPKRSQAKILRDGKKLLEERLAGLPSEMLRAIDATRRQEAKWAEEERLRQEAARRRAEAQAREKRRQERLQRRRQREEALFQVAERWKRCSLLREFAEAVRAVAVKEVGAADADPKEARWLARAARCADRHDPLVEFRRSAPGRRRPR